MSIKLMDKVWDSDLPYNEKFVAICLADWASDEGDSIFPSIERIAWKTGYKERQIYSILEELRNKRIINWNRGGSKYGTNDYRINANNLPVRDPYRPANIAPANIAGGDLQILQVEPANIAGNPSVNHQFNPSALASETEISPESPEEYFERVYPSAKSNETSPHSVEEAKQRIEQALKDGLESMTGKDIAVENYINGYVESRRPVVRSFVEKHGRTPLTKSEDKRWRSDFAEIAALGLQPIDIQEAYDYMTANRLTIKSPGSVRAVAESRRRERQVLPHRTVYNSMGEQIS